MIDPPCLTFLALIVMQTASRCKRREWSKNVTCAFLIPFQTNGLYEFVSALRFEKILNCAPEKSLHFSVIREALFSVFPEKDLITGNMRGHTGFTQIGSENLPAPDPE